MNIPDVSQCGSLAEATRIIMLSQDGICEHGGNNRGPEVDQYIIQGGGLTPPQPWCCALICFSVKNAAKQLNIAPQFQYGASVLKLWQRNQHLLLQGPAPDCLVLKNEGVNSLGHAVGHAMILLGVNDDSTLHVISGNTNAAGSREGNCVAQQNRNQSELSLGYGYIRIA